MFFDKKRVTSVIMSKMKSDGSTQESKVSEESGDHNEYTSCAEDMIAAFQSGSVRDLASALKSFHNLVKEEDAEQDAKE